MRHPILLAATVGALALLAAPALAQYGSPGGQSQGGDDSAAKAQHDSIWGTPRTLDLPGKKNAGPCPYVKTLYDAARYVELRGNREAFDAVGFTGEIEDLHAGCVYRGAEPIHVGAQVLFEFGRGPAAQGSTKEYTYWVAVTDRNYAVLDKQYFTIRATFPAGVDRVTMTDNIDGIVIPRANSKVSGGNFEVLVGFDVTPDMVAFNQAGKRFLANAGTPAPAAHTQTAAR
ncbi:MAG TPA: Tat pathway signal sequence domain protein [Caulobacteraceae bacterium]|nr:Tat pathway signal sequence domain protein [Caulobacteraceae bacterium]